MENIKKVAFNEDHLNFYREFPTINTLTKLVHSIVFAFGFQSLLTREVTFVVITDIRSGHILVLNTS